jgi:hypothetical protein
MSTHATSIQRSGDDSVEQRVVDLDDVRSAPAESACCGPAEQARCCEPDAKAECCGSSTTGGCGCR